MTYEQFKELSKAYNVIPVSKTLLADTLTPVSAYMRLREGSEHSFLFESVEGGERLARYSFIGKSPSLLLRCKGFKTTIMENGTVRESDENFFTLLKATLSRYRHPVVPGLPRFTGGLVGYIGYDAIRFIEQLPESLPNGAGIDDSILGLFTTILAFDHLKHHITIIVNVIISPDADIEAAYQGALAEIHSVETAIKKPPETTRPFRLTNGGITSNTSRERYEAIVEKGKEYITEGDIFQVVLSQRFSTGYEGDIFNAYRALRCINPSPYLYFIDFSGTHLIGSSPEILVRVEGSAAEVFPIAGTRHRGGTDEEDRALEQELLNDRKELAEHIMLVDLGRNDLGRVCELGSVEVKQLMIPVRYSHVMHIASCVSGTLPGGTSCVDVLAATFPAGTVSGAPKIRAMEIIEELEQTRRGVYAGGVGYFDFTGNMDFCITIRTMFATRGLIHFQAGAGIVADSVPAAEYEETINKSGALREALHMAEGIEP